MNGHMGSEGIECPCTAGQGMPSVPLPMVCVAFVFGIMMGKMMSRKREMLMQEGRGGGKPWMHYGMHGHHHHGEGAPPCREWHGDSPEPEMPPAEAIPER